MAFVYLFTNFSINAAQIVLQIIVHECILIISLLTWVNVMVYWPDP